MKKEHQKIIEHISDYLSKNESLRFGQALFNLRINEFKEEKETINPKNEIRDIHGDADKKILERIESQLDWLEEQKSLHR
ncbi:MAG: hypothetical protein HC854_10420 [Flavobacterium sp.]|nr:hypothetical protein [Flavobacterium sp.]